jgi:hypothetical protein
MVISGACGLKPKTLKREGVYKMGNKKTSTVKASPLQSVVIPFYVYATKDVHGNYDAAVCDDESDCIQICGMKDKDGNPIYFESDAYHLHDWCKENGLAYSRHQSDYEIKV